MLSTVVLNLLWPDSVFSIWFRYIAVPSIPISKIRYDLHMYT